MRKRIKGRKLNRERDQRKALLKSVAQALILKEKINTTLAKAKEVSSFVEKKITHARKGDIASRRLLSKYFTDKIVNKLITEIGPRYKDRKGGYTRIIKLGPRKANAAKMAVLELVK
ncbi:MAG: 50S ribosomal protein L17 [Candidatus Nealsonbacteria bacterium]